MTHRLALVARFTLVALLALVTPRSAVADDDCCAVDHAPTAGLALPLAPLAGDHDARATVMNPGGLVFLPAWDLELSALLGRPTRGGATGFGLHAAVPVDLPLLPRLAFGVAAEKLLAAPDALLPAPGEPLRLSFAAAYAPAQSVGIGATWHHFFDDTGAPKDTLDTLDLGVSLRVVRWLAAGLVVRDVTTPRFVAESVARRWLTELAVRPLGDDRLEVSAALAFDESRRQLEPAARLAVRITRGLRLTAEVQLQQRYSLAAGTTGSVPPLTSASVPERELSVGLGLELSFGATGVALYGAAGQPAGGSIGRSAAALRMRLSGDRAPSVLPRATHVERVLLGADLDGRTLLALLARLDRIARDPSVAVVLLVIADTGGGWAVAQELRAAIGRLRAAGKKTVAVATIATTRQYYIAAAAERVLLDGAGGLRLQGLTASVIYFKNLFDLLGVNAQFEKIDEYKSAPESYTLTTASREAREMRDALYGDIHARLVADLAKDRGPTPAAWQQLFDAGPYTAGEAAKAGLVDVAGEPVELDAALSEASGGDALPVSDGVVRERARTWAPRKLAVIHLEGDIVDGRSMVIPLLGRRLVGGDTIALALAEAAADPAIEAIVLHIDSPGGSALASEVIARAVVEARRQKPVVASMGDIAASGGYFAAARAERIFAAPSTITGSIGIFTGKFDLSTLFARFGVTWDTWSRGAHADLESMLRPYTDAERILIKEKLRYYYLRFVDTVATGRGLTRDQVDAVARGQVWTGTQAQSRGLVDELGGLADALAWARRRVGISVGEPHELVSLPAHRPSLFELAAGLAGGAVGRMGAVGAGDALLLDLTRTALPARLLELLPASLLVRPDAPQARLPFAILGD